MSDWQMEARHIEAEGRRTTIALEQAYWRRLDGLAGDRGWKAWINETLAQRPNGVGNARWLRVNLLSAASCLLALQANR